MQHHGMAMYAVLVRGQSNKGNPTFGSWSIAEGQLHINCLEMIKVCRTLNLRSLRAAHVPGMLNQGEDMLSRNIVPSDEWMLLPQTFQEIWGICGKADFDLFASKDNSHRRTYFSKSNDRWPANGPNFGLRFPPDLSDPPDNQPSQGTQTRSAISGPRSGETIIGSWR